MVGTLQLSFKHYVLGCSGTEIQNLSAMVWVWGSMIIRTQIYYCNLFFYVCIYLLHFSLLIFWYQFKDFKIRRSF